MLREALTMILLFIHAARMTGAQFLLVEMGSGTFAQPGLEHQSS
jgi:hypothetical protein